jgi:hypothetical protein
MLGLGATNFEDETDPGCEKISKYFDPKGNEPPQSTATSTVTSKNAASSSTAASTSETTDPPPVPRHVLVLGVSKPWGENEDEKPPAKKPFDPKTNWMCNLPGLEPSEIPLTQKCDRCGAFINIYKFVEHHDHHTARDVSREINGLPPLGFDLRPETIEAREREEFLKEREKMRQEKANKRPRGRGGGGRGGGSSAKRGKSSGNNTTSPKKPLAVKPIDSYFVKMNPSS